MRSPASSSPLLGAGQCHPPGWAALDTAVTPLSLAHTDIYWSWAAEPILVVNLSRCCISRRAIFPWSPRHDLPHLHPAAHQCELSHGQLYWCASPTLDGISPQNECVSPRLSVLWSQQSRMLLLSFLSSPIWAGPGGFSSASNSSGPQSLCVSQQYRS